MTAKIVQSHLSQESTARGWLNFFLIPVHEISLLLYSTISIHTLAAVLEADKLKLTHAVSLMTRTNCDLWPFTGYQ